MDDLLYLLVHSHSKCKVSIWSGGDISSTLKLMAVTCVWLWDLTWPCVLPETPCSSGTCIDIPPLSCLFGSNGETMGSLPWCWLVFVACVFVLHQVFTQNTLAPLRTRSAHPSNLLYRQRLSVPQNNMSPRVTLRPHRGSCCQPCLAKAKHRCPAKTFFSQGFNLKQQCVQTSGPRSDPVIGQTRREDRRHDKHTSA